MLSKCANPDCGTPFQYLRDGKLYKFELHESANGAENKPHPHPIDKKPGRRVEHFWLCGECAPLMTLALERSHKVVIVPRRKGYTRRAAAS